MKSRRGLTDADRTLWRRAVKDVRPLHKPLPTNEADHDVGIATKPSSARAQQAPARPAQVAPPQRNTTKNRRASVFAAGDPRLDRRAARGRIAVDAVLDLHGLRQAAAHDALTRFITASRACGRRCVLVITGKGERTSEGGVLRARLRDWIEEPALRAHIARASEAHRRHGGAGAVYIFLKSPRS